LKRLDHVLIVLTLIGAVATAAFHALKEWRGIPVPQPAHSARIGPADVCIWRDDQWRCGRWVPDEEGGGR